MRWPARRLAEAYQRAGQAARARQGRCGEARRWPRRWRPRGWTPEKAQVAVQGPRSRHRPQRHPRYRHAHRRPRHHDRAADHRRGRHPAARARLARCSPAARPRRSASPRSAPARTSRSSTRSRASTASTSCCTTISRPIRSGEAGRMGSPGPARGRPRQAGLAGDPSAAAGEGQVPLHAARRVARSPRATAAPRWRRSAADRSR